MVDRCFDLTRPPKEALKLDKGKVTLITQATTMALWQQGEAS